MDDLASLLAIAASWVAPGAPLPDEAGQIDDIRAYLESVRDFAQLFDGQGKRVAGYYEATHPINVAALSAAIAKAMGLSRAETEDLVRASLLHDLGLRFIPSPVRYKVGTLTSEEALLLRRHPEHSARIADLLCGPAIAEIVLAHHERFDGTGYPGCLTDNQIPLAARILAVADSFDAMSSDRIYARRYSPALAYQAIRASAGRAFDPAVTSAFLSAVAPFPVGTAVRLSSGEAGTVVRNLPDRPFRPAVRLADGREVEGKDVAGLQIVRNAARYTAGVPVALIVGGATYDGRTFNVSAEGCAVIEYSGALRQGGDLTIVFRAKGADALSVAARIVWSRPSGGRGRLLGLWFGAVPDDVRARILEISGAEAPQQAFDTDAEAPQQASDTDAEPEMAQTPGKTI
ncbi:MAG: HD domain-containing protein [Candidatus Sericytochromatia bacterium]|uniref:HD domain-containing protein n=1 Tax=Candidatus Tanganyikabacteria bacterium TaxID=2961651 RepID=A0A937X6V1_9BACT|nr:HD domain-containing protein [Candidatus Tanganyikabacteria bacterium]